MSRIALSGNPSGTGTLTIASPNTNSDATFNLPTTGGDLLVNGASQAATFSALTVNGNNISAQNSLGFRNRIINGDMRIDQRNNGAAVSGTGVFAVDRFVTDCVNAVLQSQQISDVPSGQGFVNSLRITVTTPSSNASNDFAAVNQKIEANNVADFMLGTASAATITVSFWVKASVTGTYVASFQNGLSSRRSYPATYTINSANTWEKKTITLVGDTSGTWETGNGQGIWIRFDLGSGSNFLGTANTWQSANAMRVSGAAKLSDTLNATFFITGVQLEAGSVATPFERRPYGTELALCMRYFEKSYNADVALGAVTEAGAACFTTQRSAFYQDFPNQRFAVVKRASPTITIYNASTGGTGTIRNPQAGTNINAFATSGGTGSVSLFSEGSIDAGYGLRAHFTASAEL
jgi:hypothetical protein